MWQIAKKNPPKFERYYKYVEELPHEKSKHNKDVSKNDDSVSMEVNPTAPRRRSSHS